MGCILTHPLSSGDGASYRISKPSPLPNEAAVVIETKRQIDPRGIYLQSFLNRSLPENLIFRAGIHCRSWNADSKPMSAALLSRGWAQDKSTLALTQPMAREKVLIGFQRYAEVGPRNPSNTAGPRLLESECLDHQPADTIPVDESQCRKCLKQIEAQAFWESSIK